MHPKSIKKPPNCESRVRLNDPEAHYTHVYLLLYYLNTMLTYLHCKSVVVHEQMGKFQMMIQNSLIFSNRGLK